MRALSWKAIFFAAVLCSISDTCNVYATISNPKKISALELVIENSLLLISTLDGSLIAVDQQTGDVKWKINNEPVVKVPVDNANSISPLFLPDPKDGSLYVLGGPSGFDALKKLPFTIPQLVASSPCKSTDGILYTGRKVDSWMAVDADSGKKHQVLSFDKEDFQVCPADGARTIFIGRTEYSIMMFDSVKKQKRWNVTFYDYNAGAMDGDKLMNYDLTHFATNSLGRVVTLNRDTGKLLWEQEFKSPTVAMYQIQGDTLVSVPFTSVAVDTLEALQASISGPDTKLSQTLYVGHHLHGLYALPSLIDNSVTSTITPPQLPLLIEGPKNEEKNDEKEEQSPQPSGSKNEKSHPLDFLLGHYQMPEYSQTRLQITGKVLPKPGELVIETSGRDASVQTDFSSNEPSEWQLVWEEISSGNYSVIFSSKPALAIVLSTKHFIVQQEQKMLKTVILAIIICVFSMFWYLYARMREIQELTSNQQLSTGSRGSSHPSEADREEIIEGGATVVRVGKIELLPDQVLGRGCEGTFVFHGRFEGRPVAVKRLLPECFTVADREVDLLRESDEHPNVIRYFCTEKDRQFRYIALELCAATLEDYVKGRFGVKSIKEIDVLCQATSGLAHLHSLDIVHRDIKPHNVLLSHKNGEVKAMISDFGLCKKLQRGRHSFSHRSGVAGTDGWIAPEMINPNISATCSVDIFSLGCVYYYVLSKGKHPFGDNLRRQANILSGEHNLEALQGNGNALVYNLVAAMLSHNANGRPPATAVVKHPIFWDSARILTFFQDVSDRIESEEQNSSVLSALEDSGWTVVRRNWRRHVGDEVASDLRKYRNYRGSSVRDLLRALRNKKHHYRDLSEEARKSLGEIPEEFLHYWTSRFPLLLIHSWLAMQCVQNERGLHEYYHSFRFSRNFTATLAASDNVEDPEEESPSPSKQNENKNKSYKNRMKPQVNPLWLSNWRDPTPTMPRNNDMASVNDNSERGEDQFQSKDWSKAWPEGSNRKSQIRARKKPTPDPVWNINWRDPNQSRHDPVDKE